MPSLIGSRL